jgi:hypothetical protein
VILSEPAKKMVLVIGISSLVFMGIGVAIYRSFASVPFAIGVLLMAALNIFKVFMVERTVKKTLELNEEIDGRNFVRLQYMLRYLLTGAVLVVAALTPFIDLWGAAAGILTFQIAAYAVSLMKFNDNISAEKEGG